METAGEDWFRLGRLVTRRRDVLGLSQKAVQDHGGPSPSTVRALENGRATSLSGSKRRALERALRWSDGDVDRVLAGEEPRELEHPASRPDAPTVARVETRQVNVIIPERSITRLYRAIDRTLDALEEEDAEAAKEAAIVARDLILLLWLDAEDPPATKPEPDPPPLPD